jgi:hypothetical protein
MSASLSLIGAAALLLGVVPALPRLADVLRPSGRHRAGDPLPEYAGFHDGETTIVTPIGVFAQGFRYCPDCRGEEAVIVRKDRSAHCEQCHTHIPAGDDQ